MSHENNGNAQKTTFDADQYDKFNGGMTQLLEHLTLMEMAKKNKTIIQTEYDQAKEIFAGISGYYSNKTQSGTSKNTFSEHLKPQMDSAEKIFNRIQSIAEKNGVDIKAKTSNSSPQNSTSMEEWLKNSQAIYDEEYKQNEAANKKQASAEPENPKPLVTPPPKSRQDYILEEIQQGIKDLTDKSKTFYEKIPRSATIPQDNRIENLISKGLATPQEIVENAQNTHPIMHAQVNQLVKDFLEHKKSYGTDIEKALYKNMTDEQFLDRLLTKRPIMFSGSADDRILRDGTRKGGAFEDIGTANQKPPLVLADYISYSEMKISALLGVSVPTHFINPGDRFNKGILDETGNYEKKGVYTGLVGARFEKKGEMEYPYIVITREQNTKANGYGANGNQKKSKAMAPFAKFYGKTHFPTFEEAQKDKNNNFIKIDENTYINKDVYKERMRMVIEPFLDDKNVRAFEAGNKQAYVHAVGLGLGVWSTINGKDHSASLGKLQVEVYSEILKEKNYQNISNVNFSYFPDECKTHLNTSSINNIQIDFSKRNPADALTGNDAGKFLAVQYAWDGNSYAGNEYHSGALSASGDPAAACCSTIAQLQNPEINPDAIKGKNVKAYGNIKPELTSNLDNASKAGNSIKEKLTGAISKMKSKVKKVAKIKKAASNQKEAPTLKEKTVNANSSSPAQAIPNKLDEKPTPAPAQSAAQAAPEKISAADTIRKEADEIMAKGTKEFQEWENKLNAEFNKPARPTQALPLGTKELDKNLAELIKIVADSQNFSSTANPAQATKAPTLNPQEKILISNLESKVEKAMSDLNFAGKHTDHATEVIQALSNIHALSKNIDSLKSDSTNMSMQDKLSELNKKLHSAVEVTQKQVGTAHIAKPEEPKPVEEKKPQIIEAVADKKELKPEGKSEHQSLHH